MNSGNPNASSLHATSDALAAAAESAGRTVVAIHARPRIPSSGVYWRDGHVITASHTVKRENGITVTLHEGADVDARLIGRDRTTDIALLRLEGKTAAEGNWGDAESLRVGQLVLAIGRPSIDGITAALGIVAALGGEWRTWRGGRIDRLVRLDLTVRDGFSGGPLVDASGRIVGINSSTLLRGEAATIPVSTVQRSAQQILEKGDVRRAYLGVAMQPVRVPEPIRTQHALPGNAGLMILFVEPGGPADRAGLTLGDVLVEVSDESVIDAAQVLARLGSEQVDKPLSVRVLRGGQPLRVDVTPSARPDPGAE